MDPMTSFVSAEIFDDEPWRPCGRQTPSRERRKFVRRVIPIRSGILLALSLQRLAVKRRGRRGPSRPSAGGAGRATREP
jgi:hypothetical protein